MKFLLESRSFTRQLEKTQDEQSLLTFVSSLDLRQIIGNRRSQKAIMARFLANDLRHPVTELRRRSALLATGGQCL